VIKNGRITVEVKRNLGKFKKALAYLGIIKNTKKITITEIYREDVVTKKKDVIGFHSLGDFKNDKESINDFVQELKKYKGAKAYDLNDNEIGYINNEGNLIRNENIKIDFNETILQKNGKVFAIEKNGKFLDLEGKALQNQNQFIQKSSGVYHLSGADIKYFDKDEDIKTSKGITNLNKKPVRSALKGSREATKIGEQLRKQQEEKQFAGIKKPKGAKLTKVGIPVVPTR